jgi:hypothetical protein
MKQTNKYSEVGGRSVPRIGGDLLLGDAPFSHRNWYFRLKVGARAGGEGSTQQQWLRNYSFFPSSLFHAHAPSRKLVGGSIFVRGNFARVRLESEFFSIPFS